MAIAQRQPAPGVVHHSDQRHSVCRRRVRGLLAQHHMTASMSRPANPYDNAQCESFIKTLKQEEIYCHSYRDLEDLRTICGSSSRNTTIAAACIRRSVIDPLLNSKPRVKPAVVENRSAASREVEFSRHGEIYHSDKRERPRPRTQQWQQVKQGANRTPRLIGSMSLRLTIPRRVALQQSSLPLHQPGASLTERSVEVKKNSEW